MEAECGKCGGKFQLENVGQAIKDVNCLPSIAFLECQVCQRIWKFIDCVAQCRDCGSWNLKMVSDEYAYQATVEHDRMVEMAIERERDMQ